MPAPFRPRFWIALAVIALIAASCGDDATTTTADDPDETTTTIADTTTSADLPVAESVDVGVYFVREITEPAQGGVVEAVAATQRTVTVAAGSDPAGATIVALLDGPSDFESDIGMTSAIPDGTSLLGLEIIDGVARIDLDGTYETPAGAFGDTLRVAQVVFTLTALDNVETVEFIIDGEPRDVVGSHGIDVAGGVARDDVNEARPAILIESPAPNGAVPDPLVVAGESNTFEGTVRWALTDPDGEIVEEGFTTATAGNGTWGTFEITIPAEPQDRGGLGAVILWEDSPEDGRQTNIVEVPVLWPES